MKKHINFVETDHVQIVLILLVIALCVSSTIASSERETVREYASREEDLNSEIEDLQGQVETLNEDNAELDENLQNIGYQNETMSEELSFWQESAVIVTTEGKKYHHYGCGHIEGRDYYIYNIENAEAMGYTPCLDCCG